MLQELMLNNNGEDLYHHLETPLKMKGEGGNKTIRFIRKTTLMLIQIVLDLDNSKLEAAASFK
jgi:hypothetical protein